MDITATAPVVQRFVDALHAVDSDRSTEAMASLFTSDAPVRSIDGHGSRRGPDGVAALFTQYLDQFPEVSTTFTRVTETADRAALEWSSEVRLKGGQPATYSGVTVIEFTDDGVTDFHTVYDSGALLLPAAETAPRSGDTTGGPTGGTGDTTAGEIAGFYNADSGFLPEADRAAATGRDH